MAMVANEFEDVTYVLLQTRGAEMRFSPSERINNGPSSALSLGWTTLDLRIAFRISIGPFLGCIAF